MAASGFFIDEDGKKRRPVISLGCKQGIIRIMVPGRMFQHKPAVSFEKVSLHNQ
jgi:hypothetical protein